MFNRVKIWTHGRPESIVQNPYFVSLQPCLGGESSVWWGSIMLEAPSSYPVVQKGVKTFSDWLCSHLVPMKGFADARMSWYRAALSLGGHLRRLMAPELFIAAHTISPSAFWTVGVTYLGSNLFSLTIRQHFTVPPGLILNIFSSEKITRDQSWLAIFLTNCNLFWRWVLVNNGFFTALILLNPCALNSLHTYAFDGLSGI